MVEVSSTPAPARAERQFIRCNCGHSNFMRVTHGDRRDVNAVEGTHTNATLAGTKDLHRALPSVAAASPPSLEGYRRIAGSVKISSRPLLSGPRDCPSVTRTEPGAIGRAIRVHKTAFAGCVRIVQSIRKNRTT